MKRLVSVLVVLLLVVGAGVVGWWAGRVALEPPEDPLAEGSGPVSYVVEAGSVGRSFSFTAVASWELVPVGRNAAVGVVTSVELEPGAVVSPGDVLYTVDLRPVVTAEGTVPSFRRLSLKSKGVDVAQLQALLAGLGFYDGEVDGVFGRSTRAAVKAWQKVLGIDDSGIVEPGDVVFVPELPARLVLGDLLVVGARLSGGEETVLLVPDAPFFRIPLAVEQGSLVPLSTDVFVTYPAGVWEARVEKAVESPEFGQLDLVLSGADGGPVCGVVCADWVDLSDRTLFQAEIVVIPETSGPVVPVAAISTDPGNQPHLTLADGSLVPVTIVESANGLAVVEGVEPGTEILIPSEG
ncbi:MAG: peptidoglycan-binding protein [Acidimicrobiia bacterium]